MILKGRLPMKIYENIGLCFYIAWAISPNVAFNHLNSTHKLKPTLSSLQNKGNFMKRSLKLSKASSFQRTDGHSHSHIYYRDGKRAFQSLQRSAS